MKRFVTLLVGALLSASAFSATPKPFDGCAQHFFKGFVPVPTANRPGQLRALCFDDFAVLHSGESKTAIYAAEHLTPASLAEARRQTRKDRFYEEARLPFADRSQLKDYKGSGFDKGHLAAAIQRASPEAMAQSFSLANMVPETPHHNQVVWKNGVEKATQKYVARGNEVYVLTGPIYQGRVQTIGENHVWVPTAMFKLVFDPVNRSAWAYVVDNTDDAKVKGVVSYQDLVRTTGIEFLPTGAVVK